MSSRIMDDKRDIKMISGGTGEDGWAYRTDYPTRTPLWACDEIVPYWEDGQMAGVVWFEVRKGGAVVARVNAAQVREILYGPASGEEER